VGSALRRAIDENAPDLVRQALAKDNRNLNRPLEDGFLPALYAAEKGAVKALDVLLQEGAETEQDGQTAFAAAAKAGHIKVLETIARHQRIPRAQIEEAMEAAALRGLNDVLVLLLKNHKARITPRVMEVASWDPGRSRSKSTATLKLLIAQGGDVNTRLNHDGISLLHAAALAAKVDVIRLLVERGAPVNARDRQGRTPLIYMMGDVVLEPDALLAMRELLKLGADVSVVDRFGNDALMHYLWEMHRSQNEFDPKIIKLLTPPGKGVLGPTAKLFVAIWNDDLNTMRDAIATGANLKHVCPSGDNALTLAAARDVVEGVQLLLDAGSDPNRPGRTRTPMVSAARHGHLPVVKQLLAAGALLHGGKSGKSKGSELDTNALFAAEANHQPEVAEYLKTLT
jgi:ankyrin repeat protein